MNHILSIFVSVLLLHPLLQNPLPVTNQWWAEAKALGQKAANLKKARYEANAKVDARIHEQVEKELRQKPATPYYALYDELRHKAAPEFAAIKQEYDLPITNAMNGYVTFLQERKLGEGEIYVAKMEMRPEILYQEKAKYTEDARQNRVHGTVLLSIVFSADGRIMHVRVIRGLPDGLNEEAMKVANEIIFLPALKNGQPVTVRMSVEYTFNLI